MYFAVFGIRSSFPAPLPVNCLTMLQSGRISVPMGFDSPRADRVRSVLSAGKGETSPFSRISRGSSPRLLRSGSKRNATSMRRGDSPSYSGSRHALNALLSSVSSCGDVTREASAAKKRASEEDRDSKKVCVGLDSQMELQEGENLKDRENSRSHGASRILMLVEKARGSTAMPPERETGDCGIAEDSSDSEVHKQQQQHKEGDVVPGEGLNMEYTSSADVLSAVTAECVMDEEAPNNINNTNNNIGHTEEGHLPGAKEDSQAGDSDDEETINPRLLTWEELGTRQFEVQSLLRLKIDGSESSITSAEIVVLSLTKFLSALHKYAALRRDSNTGFLFQDLLQISSGGGAAPEGCRSDEHARKLAEGAELLKEAVRIKVQDSKDVETAGVAVCESYELFFGVRQHAKSKGITLAQCWKHLNDGL